MSFYFIGGEDHDFTKVGGAAVTVDTATSAARYTANSRCSLKVGPSAATTDGWSGSLSSAQTDFWLSAQLYASSTTTTANCELLSLTDGATRRVVLRMNSATGFIDVCKRTAAGVYTVLASTGVKPSIGLQKIDLHVSYIASGTIDFYMGNTLLGSYSGDFRTDSATSLSGFVLGNGTTNGAQFSAWSEAIVSSSDTRGLSLVTMAPAANGNTFAWSNSYASVDETTLDDADLCTSSVTGDLAQTTITALSGLSSGTPAIRAVCVSARAQKGGSGPQNAYLNVRTGGNDYDSSSVALPAAFGRVAAVFETNPATSGSWAYTDLTAAGFNIGIKSLT
jgi:hypothetical protein